MVALMSLMAVAGLFAVVAIITIAIIKVDNWRYDRREAKRRQAHPQLYLLFDECEEAGRQSCMWYNEQIAPLKREVDAILKEIDYYPAEQRAEKEAELEDLRKRIYVAQAIKKSLEEKVEEVRTKIKKYVADNNLEWAKKWGW
jgi:predicted  nucleic acid-binding Zn-ribbon protein